MPRRQQTFLRISRFSSDRQGHSCGLVCRNPKVLQGHAIPVFLIAEAAGSAVPIQKKFGHLERGEKIVRSGKGNRAGLSCPIFDCPEEMLYNSGMLQKGERLAMEEDRFHRGEVAAVPCGDYSEAEAERAVREALSLLGGLSSYIRPGMRVGIKCNLVSAMAPEKAATTSPALLSALCRQITDLGATAVLGDSPGGAYTQAALRNVYRVCGLLPLVREGVSLNEDISVERAAFPAAKSIGAFQYTGWLRSCDCIIGFSKLKSHGMMGMTGAVKNLFGTIPGFTKPEYHARFPEKRAFADMLVDLNEYFRPVLSFCDAVECMEGNGPTAGTPRHLGLLLASPSPYCLDLVGSSLIGMRPEEVETIRAAGDRGLAPASAQNVETRGADIASYRIEDFVPAAPKSTLFGSAGLSGRVLPGLLQAFFSTRPEVRKSACTGCGTCSRICPKKAITMETGVPTIDRKQCIRCFCCQEFCPVGAMRVHRGPVASAMGLLSGRRAGERERAREETQEHTEEGKTVTEKKIPEKEERAKILILGDSHGGNGNLRYAIGQELPIDMLIHCGDVQGDLMQILGGDPPYAVTCVKGNTDAGNLPLSRMLDVCGHRILVCHGHALGVRSGTERILQAAREQGCDVVCFGHTHIPVCREQDGILVLNPGSISLPRTDDRKKTYAVLTLERGKAPKAQIRTIPDRIPQRWE